MTDESQVQRRAALSSGLATSLLNRVVAALVPIVSIPLALSHLGAKNYGAWAAAVSLSAFAAFADFGVGTGLMTRLSRIPTDEIRSGIDKRAAALVSSAYATVMALASIALLIVLLVAATVDLGHLLGGSSGSQATERIVVLTILGLLLNVPVSMVVRAQYAVGQQARSNLWQAGGSLFTLGAMWTATMLSPDPEIFVALAALAAPLVGLLNSIQFYWMDEVGRQLVPWPSRATAANAASLLSLGARFGLITALMSAGVALDPWLVARASGLENVVDYAVPYRIFALLASIGVVVTLPLWPVYSRAISAGDVGWIGRVTRRVALLSTLAMSVAVVATILVGPAVIDAWLGAVVDVDHTMWVGLGVWCIAQAAAGPFFMVQNGAEVLIPQTIGYALCLVVLPLKWVIAVHSGYEWIPWVSSLSFLIFVGSACWIGYGLSLRKAFDLHGG